MKNCLLFVTLVLIAVVAGCDRENDAVVDPKKKFNKQLGIDTVLIDTYLSSRGITAVKDSTGIRYVIHTPGTGKSPKYNKNGVPGDCFETSYLGKLLDGDVPFDTAATFRTSLSSGIIRGWQIGFQRLKVGDSATLYIPSVYAYGEAGSGTKIPKNAVLYFHVKLRKVVTPEFNPATGTFTCYYED